MLREGILGVNSGRGRGEALTRYKEKGRAPQGRDQPVQRLYSGRKQREERLKESQWDSGKWGREQDRAGEPMPRSSVCTLGAMGSH